MVLPDRTWAVDGGARLPRVPSVRQARLGDAMTRPSPRKVKALPTIYLIVLCPNLVIDWRYNRADAVERAKRSPVVLRVVKYVPAPARRAKGAKS